ncbi:DnaJ subfamily B member 12 [Spatholobus suberectus]|nr:DnaJ subfamily B member 12 [Spatholobus suberectus]
MNSLVRDLGDKALLRRLRPNPSHRGHPLATDKSVNNHLDWYVVLQHYRLTILLHPDKSRFHFADHTFKLVINAWALLSDPIKKVVYDKELSFLSRVDLSIHKWVQQEKLLSTYNGKRKSRQILRYKQGGVGDEPAMAKGKIRGGDEASNNVGGKNGKDVEVEGNMNREIMMRMWDFKSFLNWLHESLI